MLGSILVLGLLAQVSAAPLFFDEVVAVVGGTPILFSDVRAQMRESLGSRFAELCHGRQYRYQAMMLQRSWNESLRFLMEQTILTEEAKRRQIEISDDDVSNYIYSVASTAHMKVDEFMRSMASAGLSAQKVRNIIKMRLLQQRLMAHKIPALMATDQEVESMKHWMVQKEDAPHVVADVTFEPTRPGYRPYTRKDARFYYYSVPPKVWRAMVDAGPWSRKFTVTTSEGKYTIRVRELHLHPREANPPSAAQIRNRILQWRLQHATKAWMSSLQHKYPREVFRPVPDLGLLCSGI